MTRSFGSRALALAAGLLISGLLPALALEPPTREQIARYRLDGTLPARVARAKAIGNHRLPPRSAARLRANLDRLTGRRPAASTIVHAPAPLRRRSSSASVLAPPSAWQGLPTTGTVKILVLLLAFSDYPGQSDKAVLESRLFGPGTGVLPYDSLANFYDRSSYGQLTITGNVLGWYQTSYARSTINATDTGRENVIKEALSYYDGQGHDFSQYDNDGDGTIDYLCVFWSGPHEEWSDFWWGYDTGFYDASYRLDGKRLANYSWQWELYDYPSGSFSPATIIHETGHALGVPDYYDYDDAVGPRGGVGGLDIMDAEGDHNGFSKFMLDWITPTVVSSGTQALTLRASGLYPDAALFMPNAVAGRIFDEYFMVQNRLRCGNDTGLFTHGDGLLVWHIDARLNAWSTDFLYDNSYTAHKLLRLMEGDGLEEIETYAALADPGDYYRAGMAFGPATVPDTDRYNGASTAMTLSGITGTASPMGAIITSTEDAPSVAITGLAAGQTVYGTIPVAVEASDSAGLARVDLYVDSELVQTLTAPPYDFVLDTTQVGNGTRAIRAVATDMNDLSGQDAVSVYVDNIFPPLDLTAVRSANRSLLLREYVNVVSWKDNPLNTSLRKYRLYLVTTGGRALLAEADKAAVGSTYRFLHRGIDRTATYTYEVVGVGSLGREGIAATATVR